MTDIDNLIGERGKTHGEWGEQARRAQEILRVLQEGSRWDDVPDEMREALHMIAHKLSRIVAGDPYHQDHWTDIAGYARLGEKHAQTTGWKPETSTGCTKMPPVRKKANYFLSYRLKSILATIEGVVQSDLDTNDIQTLAGHGYIYQHKVTERWLRTEKGTDVCETL